MIPISPELRRNAWLELTPMRLLLMPAVLGLVFLLAFALTDRHEAEALTLTGASMFVLVTVLWGAHLGAANLTEERLQGTWDWQRMSSITPFELALGKLIGGPLYAWYGGVLCLVVFLVAGVSAELEHLAYWTALMVGLALAAHAVVLLTTAAAVSKYGPSLAGRIRSAVMLLGLVVLVQAWRIVVPPAVESGTWAIQWYAWAVPGKLLWLGTLYLIVAWAWLGLYRLFRGELGFRNAPWVFGTFVLFLMLYVAGFQAAPGELLPRRVNAAADSTLVARLCIAALIGGVLTLLALLHERHDPVAYRRLLQGRRGGAFPAHLIPRWGVCFGLATVAVAGSWLVSGAGPVSLLLSAAWLFLVRDAAVILALNLRTVRKSADGLVLVYLLVAYALLPGLTGGASLFVPAAQAGVGALLVPPAVEAVVALVLLRLRWTRRFGRTAQGLRESNP